MIDVENIKSLISAKVIADSISPRGDRLTSIEVKFHRFILAEVNTHRKFTRSSASSRAIPVTKTLEKLGLPGGKAFPISWPSEKPGMQGGVPLEGDRLEEAQALLEDIAEVTMGMVEQYVEDHPDPADRLHKSVLNRPLEWFSWHTALITSTEWENYFRQRRSPLAQPEFYAVAEVMHQALEASTPLALDYGDWHLPYMSDHDLLECIALGYDYRDVSVGRCARTSYETQDGVRDMIKDLELAQRLKNPGDGPPHAAPLEHVATPFRQHRPDGRTSPLGNFDGWSQYRHLVLGF